MIVASASSQSKPRLTGSIARALDDGEARARDGDRHVAGIGAKRCHRREHGSARRSRRAADDENGARGELRIVRRTEWDSLHQPRRGTACRGRDLAEADVGDDDVAGVELPGATHTPILRA